MENKARLGQLVRSKVGRDKGAYYLVIKVGPGSNVLVADGIRRKAEAPKLKNEKHVALHNLIADEIAVKITAGQDVSDLDLRTALKALLDEQVPVRSEEVD